MTKAEYQTYLESEKWEKFSREIRRDRMVCEVCKMDNEKCIKKYRQRLNVHHKTYARVGNEKKEDVVLLCWGCHMTKHGMGGWVSFCNSRSMEEVQKIPLICANCEKPTGNYVYNFDEITPVLCSECRA